MPETACNLASPAVKARGDMSVSKCLRILEVPFYTVEFVHKWPQILHVVAFGGRVYDTGVTL